MDATCMPRWLSSSYKLSDELRSAFLCCSSLRSPLGLPASLASQRRNSPPSRGKSTVNAVGAVNGANGSSRLNYRDAIFSLFSRSGVRKASGHGFGERATGRSRLKTDSLRWHGFDHWVLPDFSRAAVKEEAEVEKDVAEIIDGKAIAMQIREEIAEEVKQMKEKVGHVPGLAVVLVGKRKDSQTYVRSKKKACEQAGIFSLGVELPEDSSEKDVLDAVEELNADPRVHGVLVQLPLPKHMSEEKVLSGVSEEKDVDGFHPLNMGKLAMAGREPLFVPCTPKGCIELLRRSGIEIAHKKAVVIGRSNVVGMPAALLLQRFDATVTIVHSRTPNPEEVTRQADIVIAAAGVPNLVRKDWLKPGCVIIDVGINAVEDATDKRGYRLVGDVCYEEARYVASAITPVPGGVGPMTIAMLLSNTLVSAKRRYGLDDS